ncbi:hypothetical protein [Streptomonospora wellingtoniae]|uniref:Integral membrane protein n=1 Tax=Streptomonospora wellingtoniae TaxID=3075544 RepID=A0ABU2KUT0_9ACTN|nr:hypothetical protein [Streptomonospora sp. DSM 45055]MDT0303049.1 hypothetical protein [Streptomonospora sp. DSM 45055]
MGDDGSGADVRDGASEAECVKGGVRLLGGTAAASAGLLAAAHLLVAGAATAGGVPAGSGVLAWILLPPLAAVGFALATLALAFDRKPLPRGLLLGLVWTHTALMAALVALSLFGFAAGVPLTLSSAFGGPFAYALVSLAAYAAFLTRLLRQRPTAAAAPRT